jgi:bacterioferritin
MYNYSKGNTSMPINDYSLDIPYPPIEIERRNTNYAQLLLHDYAGAQGELTALTQYFYQHLLTKYRYKEFSSTMEYISIEEMRHMEMLGELIVLLGGNPLYRTIDQYNSTYWTSENVSPLQNIHKFLNANIKSENIAIDNYRLRITQIRDVKIQHVLERIILDEEHHIATFKEFLS